MKKSQKLFLTIIFLAVSVYLFGVKTPITKAATLEELLAKIAVLQAQIAQLQEQIAEIQGQEVWCYDFNVNLRVEMRGEKVRALQTALQKEGFTIPVSETEKEGYFGDFTASAVVQFQEKYASEILTPWGLTTGTGYVGSTTRARLNQLYGCGATTSSCISTDSDYKDIYTKGTTTYKGQSKTDYCINSITLKEYYCDTAMGDVHWLNKFEYDCPNGCSNGACVKSVISPSITVLSPNGGEVWQVGTTHNITWTSSNLPAGASVDISLLILDAAGNILSKPISIPNQSFTQSFPATSGSYTWTIPTTIQNDILSFTGSSNMNYLKIQVSDIGKTGAYDRSDGTFSISTAIQPSITVLSPNGGEVWTFGTRQKILWESNGITNNLEIYLRFQDGSVCRLANNVPPVSVTENPTANMGGYEITIQENQACSNIPMNITAGQYKIDIRSTDSPAMTSGNDSSDDYFSIVAAGTACTDSDGGKNYYAKGTATYTGSGTPAQGYTQLTDFCAGGGGIDIRTLREAYCSVDGYVLSENYICPNGCEDGACVQSTVVTNKIFIEAEDYSNRTFTAIGSWWEVDGITNKFIEGPNKGEVAPTAKSGASGNYMESLGKFIGYVSPISENYNGPFLDYKMSVERAGNYRLYIRWTGRDGDTDSVYALILKPDGTLLRGSAGSGFDFFLYHGRTSWIWDNFGIKDRTDSAYAGRDSYATWVIPEPGTYTIRLAFREEESAVDALVFQTENLPPPTESETARITVLSPNGGEAYKIGSQITVNWKTNNVPSSQKLDVIRLRAYPNGQEYNLAYGVLNDSQEVITIPSSIPVGAYTLEIKTYVNNVLVMDSSDNYFKIVDVSQPSITVISPNGGEKWVKGQTYQIQWTPQNIASSKNVQIELSSTTLYRKFIAKMPVLSGWYSWTIPSDLADSDKYGLSVTCYECYAENNNKVVADSSDNYFSIVAATTQPSITVISPNGGEIWPTGTTQTIKWTPSSSGTVRLEIRKGASPYVMISSCCISDTGSYAWPIPTGFALANDYRVRVTKSDGAGPYDESDSPFSIVSGGLGMENIETQLASISKIVSELMEKIKELTK